MKRDPPSSEITPEPVYERRRAFLRNAGLYVAGSVAVGGGLYALTSGRAGGRATPPPEDGAGAAGAPPPLSIASRTEGPPGEALTPWGDVTTYNNFYELGLGKDDPAEHAAKLVTRPWTVRIDGEVHRPVEVGIDELLRWFPLEERVYRMRCVEAWSMVIPWDGFPLASLLRRVEPTGKARYVAFETVHDPERLPGQRRPVLDWPYVEGLRLDEALHPLTLLAVGLYGKALPGQNGAPLRLVVPWKYGFKGVKSIVRLTLTEHEPRTSWNRAAPDEYGFYANVNPSVDHPRWSQATERRIGELGRRETLPFNGYGEEVASLYAGMDLRRHF